MLTPRSRIEKLRNDGIVFSQALDMARRPQEFSLEEAIKLAKLAAIVPENLNPTDCRYLVERMMYGGYILVTVYKRISNERPMGPLSVDIEMGGTPPEVESNDIELIAERRVYMIL